MNKSDVGATHRQNLHELIVGAQGIALTRALQAEVDRIEVHNGELRDRENAIPGRARGNLSVDAFCALAAGKIAQWLSGYAAALATTRNARPCAGLPIAIA